MKMVWSAVFLAVLLVGFGGGDLLAQCSAPARPGVRICEPTPNATVVYVPAIEVNSTAESGSIYQFIIYDNGHEIFAGSPYQSGVTLYDAVVRNGTHNIVVNAWDTGGHLLQAKVTFYVTGEGYPLFCSAPGTPGINLCVPPANAPVGLGIPVAATATGYSKITAINAYLDGKLQAGEQGNNYISTAVYASTVGYHSIATVAYDSSGHSFVAKKTVLSTYGAYDCPPKGTGPCTPGFEINMPQPDEYVGSSFSVDAQILDPPHPITAIKVYLGGTQIAASNGPTLRQTVTASVSGTHILTFQAWDTAGHLYRLQQNININVPH